MPAIVDEATWIPELDREDLLYHRLFLAEKWLVLSCVTGMPIRATRVSATSSTAAPRCTSRRWASPTRAHPTAAYTEALDLTGAHQSSYGREAAGVLAAAVAEAMRPDATAESVVEVTLRLAKDATRTAIEAVAEAASTLDGWRDGGLATLRAAFAPFDSVGEHYARPAQNARIPSRLHSIEEVPIALGLLLATRGDYTETMLGGVNYGRDSDSIASMGGAIAAALGSPVPRELDRRDRHGEQARPRGARTHDGRGRGGDLRQGPRALRGAGRLPSAQRRPFESDVDPAGGSRRSRAPAGARGRQGCRCGRGAVARRRRPPGAGPRRVAGGLAAAAGCGSRTSCSTSSTSCRGR